MKRIALILLSLFFLAVLVIGTSNNLMGYFRYIISQNKSFSSAKNQYQNLYFYSFLRQFRLPIDYRSSIKIKRIENTKKVNLFVICDSYIYMFVDRGHIPQDFKSFKLVKWEKGQRGFELDRLDTNQINVLLIERTERTLKDLVDTSYIVNHIEPKSEEVSAPGASPSSYFELSSIFNPDIETNLELLLFDYVFLNRIKETKAALNQKIFGRVHKDVVLSRDGEYLFKKETVDPKDPRSSFYPTSNATVDSIVSSLNYISRKYKSKGLDEVYFLAAPSSVTIMDGERGTYNNLITRIQHHAKLEASMTDAYSVFKDTNIPLYMKGDTHWNYNGFNIWTNLFYHQIDSLVQKKEMKTRKIQ